MLKIVHIKFLIFFLMIFSFIQVFSETVDQMSPSEIIHSENKKAEALASFAKILNLIDSQYVDPEKVDLDRIVEKAFHAMFSDLDPHSSYLSPKNFQKFVNFDPDKKEHKSTSFSDLSHDIAYLKLSIFNADSYSEVRNHLIGFQKTHQNKMQGLILDLRDNPGGLFDQSIQIANLFLDSGIIVSTVGRERQMPQEVEYAIKSESMTDFPIIVLVNENTASSSEIVAGALQDRNRALIMGSVTYGKGSVQKVVPLPNGGAAKLTIARYYTPSGRSIQAEGVIPDVMFLPHGEKKLKQYISKKNLKTSLKNSIQQEIDHWEKSLQDDDVLKQAYLYLRRAL